MTELKHNYETIFVLDATLADEEIAALVEKFKTLVEKNAEITKIDDWGKRRLAYEIDFKTEGYYVLIDFTSAPEFPKELERVYGITDGLLRSIVIRTDDGKDA